MLIEDIFKCVHTVCTFVFTKTTSVILSFTIMIKVFGKGRARIPEDLIKA